MWSCFGQESSTSELGTSFARFNNIGKLRLPMCFYFMLQSEIAEGLGLHKLTPTMDGMKSRRHLYRPGRSAPSAHPSPGQAHAPATPRPLIFIDPSPVQSFSFIVRAQASPTSHLRKRENSFDRFDFAERRNYLGKGFAPCPKLPIVNKANLKCAREVAVNGSFPQA